MAHLRIAILTVSCFAAWVGMPALAVETTIPTDGSHGSAVAGTTRSAVLITAPSHGSTVRDQIKVGGSFAPTVEDDIWVLVWPELAPDKGWPQSHDADKGRPASKDPAKHAWSTVASFGGPPQTYEIAVYTADRRSSRALSELLRGWASKKAYPGVTRDDLPAGLVERHRITVRKP